MNSMEENLPPGFRFHPTDEELITYYLNNKIANRGFTCKAIAVVDLNKCEPWDLPALATMGEKEWYFFNLKDRKYPTGLRTNRATQAGYWKTTGKDKEIYRGGVTVGMKKTLVFYRGRAPKGEKSNWVMHEYRPEAKPTFKSNKDEWVVCRVFKKSSSSSAKKPPPSPSSSRQYTAQDDSPTRTTTVINEFGETIEIPNDNVPNGLDKSHTNSSNRYYNCCIDDPIANRIQPLNQYNISSMNMYNTDLNWAMSKQPSAAAGITSLTNHNQSLQWSSSGSFLNTSNMALNSLLLKALQLRSYQPTPFTNPALMTCDDYSSAFDNPSQQAAGNITTSFGTDFNSNMLAASSSSSQQQQLQTHDQVQEQAFSMDSIW